jgi:hypothetical protein
MALLLFIVSREDPALFQSLRREFAAEPDIEVILDRRVEGDPGGGPRERERRQRPEIDERLYSLGWAIVQTGRR